MPKRIIICATQVPFVYGGAEQLVNSLGEALRTRGHIVETVQLPFAWYPVQRITESALAWRMIDITTVNGMPVDQVICTKFPSYLVRHPHKVIWLVHQHRQAYDQYGTTLSDFCNTAEDRAVRDTIFRLDRHGFSEAQRIYTISRNVSQRLRYFNAVESTPLYPPSRYAHLLHHGPYGDYILSVARLDQAKRLELLLQALHHTPGTVRVIFAGTGPDHERLERLTTQLGLGQRVQFLGFVSDAALVELYANARAIYYAPIDEDYGFATIEAFGAAKPVLTTEDAGGVLEFVEDDVTGYVVPADPAAIAARLTTLIQDANRAEQLGRAGQARIKNITWNQVVDNLVI